MFDVKITIGTTTELGTTLNRIADALSGQCTPAPAVNSGNQSVAAVSAPAPAPAPAAPAPVPAPVPAPAVPIAQPAAPAVPVAQPVAAPVPAAQPAPAPAVPVAQTAAPTYTKEQVAAAGAALIQSNPDKKAELQALLAQFGAPYIGALPDEHLGAFATALRQLGANI